MARGMRVQGTSKSTCQLSSDSTWLFGGMTEQQIRDCLIHKKGVWGCVKTSKTSDALEISWCWC